MKVFNNTSENFLGNYLCDCYEKKSELYFITIRHYYITSKWQGYCKDKIIVFDEEPFEEVIKCFKKGISCEISKYNTHYLTELIPYNDEELDFTIQAEWNKIDGIWINEEFKEKYNK